MNYYNILVGIKSNKYFTYKSEKEYDIGSIVQVPFRNRIILGLIICKIKQNNTKQQIKNIIELHFDRPVENMYFEFIDWFSNYYFIEKGLIFRNLIPSLSKNKKRYIIKKEFQHKYKIKSFDTPIAKSHIKKQLKLKEQEFNELLKNNILVEEIEPIVHKEPLNIHLNKEQEKGFNTIKHSIEQNIHKTYLLTGPPSSGKSEVYIKAMHYIFENTKKNILLLLPEIGLVDYVKKRIQREFGSINVAILHSELSNGERYFYINEILRKNRRIILGTRSAVFAPIDNLGLVIIDEEQDMSFKQQDASPFYSGRDMGIFLAYKNNAPAVLVSATPSSETYYNTIKGKYELIQLKHTYIKREKPDIHLFNSRIEKNIFPVNIIDCINDNIKNSRQTIIFLNRRGYLNLYKCTNCNEYFKCDNCSVSYSYHKDINMFMCHYCGHKEAYNSRCPKCGGTLKSMGIIGTQKVESILKSLFPDIRIQRMDIDAVSTKGMRKKIIDEMINGQTDILIGTQMVSKGYDIPNVDTIIMLNADAMINIPDINRQEHFMQLLIQTAGRAGRRDKKGTIFIDMDNPGKLSHIIYTLDYMRYIKKELKEREELSFPPYTKMMRIFVKNKDKQKALKEINLIHSILCRIKHKSIIILPPVPAIIHKVQSKYTFNIYIFYNSFSTISPYIKKIKNKFPNIYIDNA